MTQMLTAEQLDELERLFIAAKCEDVGLVAKNEQYRQLIRAMLDSAPNLIKAARKNERLRAENEDLKLQLRVVDGDPNDNSV